MNKDQNTKTPNDLSLEELIRNFYQSEYEQYEFGSQIEEKVMKRIEQRNNIKSAKPSGRSFRLTPFRVVLASIILVIGLVVLVTPLRSLAQSGLDGLLAKFGYTRQPAVALATSVSSNTTNNTTPGPSTSPNCDRIIHTDSGGSMCMHDTPTKSYSQEEASKLAGFSVKIPTYIPRSYVTNNYFTFYPQNEKIVRWLATYSIRFNGDASKINPQCISNFISLTQYAASTQLPATTPLEGAKASEVKVLDSNGLWIENLSSISCDGMASDGKVKTITVTRNSLSWERKGVKYELESGGLASELNLEEMRKIAESLK